MIALITGGATGIGYGFAQAYADLGYNLILTSRNLDNLHKAKKELEEKYSNKVMIFVCDLTKEEERENLFNYTKNYSIDVFVNNAGRGLSEDFIYANFLEEQKIIDLNIVAFQALLKHYLQQMNNENKGRIINISSIGAFLSGPGSATYYASKAYVTSLVRAVSYEMKDSNIFIQLVFPGATKSDFYKEARTKEKSYKYDPYLIALKTINSTKREITPGFKAKMIVFFNKILPKKLVRRLTYKRQVKMRS